MLCCPYTSWGNLPFVALHNAGSHSQELQLKLHLLFFLYSSQQAFIPENVSVSPVSEVAIFSSSISFPAASIFPMPWRMSLQIPRGISWNNDVPMCSRGVLKPKVCTFSFLSPVSRVSHRFMYLCTGVAPRSVKISPEHSTAQAPLPLTDFECKTPSGLSTSGHGNSPYWGLRVTKDNSFSRASEGIISCILDQMVR